MFFKSYKFTMITCFCAIFVQAVISNIIPIIFIPLKTLYNLNYADLGILVGINFTTQFISDILFSGAIDKIGYRKLLLPATFFHL